MASPTTNTTSYPMATATTPCALRKGGTIAFISPSARLNHILAGPLNRAKAYLEHLGYTIKIILDTTAPPDFQASVHQRCEEIHTAFRDPAVSAIICTLGGSHANELLPHLDYAVIRANPKIFCGYSDITVLHHAFFTQTGLRTFYGPAAITELGDAPAPMAFTVDHLLHVLQGSADKPSGPVPRSLEYDGILPGFFNNPASLSPRQLTPSPGWTWLRPGKAQGRIYGGCLPTILRLAGTKFWPNYQGRILLLENPMGEKMTDPLPLDATRADMADLVNLGVFEKICGLVVGRPFGYDEEMKKKFKQMVLDQCYGTDFPILMDVDVGHTSPMVTVPLDAMVGLDSERDEWSFLEASVMGE